MEVILIEDIPHLGKIGDVVKVKDGYGRNFLLPRKKALISNSKNMQALEAQKRMVAAKAAKAMDAASSIQTKLEDLILKIEKEVGTNDRLFGSVTNKDIAEELAKLGISIDRHKIILEAPIKTVGDHDVEIKLHTEVKSSLKVSVVPKS